MAIGKVPGQNHIIKHFENAIKMGKISHAYIINGEKKTGKMDLALTFARALQCEANRGDNPIGYSCNECKSCKQVLSGNQPDIKFVTYEKSGIGVDEIRDQLNNDIDIKPYSSKYKVYIINESEKMTVQAQNALLKTIEEPPEYAVIILLTTNADLFLPTILSRCVLLNVRPVNEDLVVNKLTSEYGISNYEAKVAAAFAGGNLGKAIEIATSEDFKELKDGVVSTINSLEKGGMDVITENIKLANSFKKNINEYFSVMRLYFRDILMFKATKDDKCLIFKDEYNMVKDLSDKFDYYDINVVLNSIDDAEGKINSNVNFDITIEVLLLTIKERIKK